MVKIPIYTGLNIGGGPRPCGEDWRVNSAGIKFLGDGADAQVRPKEAVALEVEGKWVRVVTWPNSFYITKKSYQTLLVPLWGIVSVGLKPCLDCIGAVICSEHRKGVVLF